MRRGLLISLIMFFTSFFYLLLWNWAISNNARRNNSVLAFFDHFTLNDVCRNDFPSDVFSKFNFNGRDYIGIISILGHNINLPIEDICDNSIIRKQSVCRYSNDSFIFLGTNFKDSFRNYESYDVKDQVLVKNFLGECFLFEITSVKRIRDFNAILDDKIDIVLIIKDYFSLEYVLFEGTLIS